MGVLVGHVAELWRYPVKSMRGEPCECLAMDASGLVGDRRYAFESVDSPVGKPLLRSAQRTAMMRAQARMQDEGGPPLIALGSGEMLPVDDERLLAGLAGLVGGELTLRHDRRRPFTDVRPIAFHSLQTIAELGREMGRALDGRRLRSNMVIDLVGGRAFEEDETAGCTLSVGDAVRLRVLERIPRCRMVALDPETAEEDRTLLKHLARYHQGRAGMYARASVAGAVRVGDEVRLVGEG